MLALSIAANGLLGLWIGNRLAHSIYRELGYKPMLKKLENTLLLLCIYTAICFGLLYLATAPAPAEPCTCAGKADCQTMTFDVDGTGECLAYCALAADATACCI